MKSLILSCSKRATSCLTSLDTCSYSSFESVTLFSAFWLMLSLNVLKKQTNKGCGSPLRSAAVSNLVYQSESALESYSFHDSFWSLSNHSLNFSTDKMSVSSMWKQAMSISKNIIREISDSRELNWSAANTHQTQLKLWSDPDLTGSYVTLAIFVQHQRAQIGTERAELQRRRQLDRL